MSAPGSDHHLHGRPGAWTRGIKTLQAELSTYDNKTLLPMTFPRLHVRLSTWSFHFNNALRLANMREVHRYEERHEMSPDEF